MRRVTAANHRKSFDGGSLLADFAPSTKSGETAAEIGKRRNSRGEPPAPRLDGEIVRISKSRRRNCGDQALIIHNLGWHQGIARASRRAALHPDGDIREKIELCFRHRGMMPGVVRLSNQQ